jgi:hypothetical protein
MSNFRGVYEATHASSVAKEGWVEIMNPVNDKVEMKTDLPHCSIISSFSVFDTIFDTIVISQQPNNYCYNDGLPNA